MDSDINTLDATGVAIEEDEHMGPSARLLEPLVNRVARLPASVHMKLLAGFLLIALLLLAMGALSIAVLRRVDGQVDELAALHTQTDQTRRLIYDVTAQSHFRAMAIADVDDDSWTPKILAAKERFDENLTSLRVDAIAGSVSLFDSLAASNEEYRESGDQVTALFDAGDVDAALALHISDEHEISHKLENDLNVLIADSETKLDEATAEFDSDRRFLTIAIASFSGFSLLGALALGAILSLALINPVRRVDRALALIADGDFRARVGFPTGTSSGG